MKFLGNQLVRGETSPEDDYPTCVFNGCQDETLAVDQPGCKLVCLDLFNGTVLPSPFTNLLRLIGEDDVGHLQSINSTLGVPEANPNLVNALYGTLGGCFFCWALFTNGGSHRPRYYLKRLRYADPTGANLDLPPLSPTEKKKRWVHGIAMLECE